LPILASVFPPKPLLLAQQLATNCHLKSGNNFQPTTTTSSNNYNDNDGSATTFPVSHLLHVSGDVLQQSTLVIFIKHNDFLFNMC